MKLLKRKQTVFVLILAAYALTVIGIACLQDYRVGVGAWMGLTSLTFAIAVWAWLGTTKLITGALIASLALMPVRAGEETKPKPELVGVVIGCGCLLVGAGVCWAIWRICKKLPPPPPKKSPPPTTNVGDTVSILINSAAPGLLMPDTDISYTAVDYEVLPLTFQSSTNGIDWTDEYTATNWLGPDRVFSVLYSNSVPLMTNQTKAYWTNETMVMNFSDVMTTRETAPVRMWRTVQR